MPARTVLTAEIDRLADNGLSAPEITAIVGRDRSYVEYRLNLFNVANRGSGASAVFIDPKKDAAFVRAVVAEGLRLGLSSKGAA